MKTLAVILLSLFTMGNSTKNLHDFKVKTIEGEEISLSQFKGKKVLVVNTASECGFTPQYKELEDLYKKYKDKNFVVVGFPANNFGGQEPGSNTDIKAFCTKNYGVTFPMMSKISVKGDDMDALYKWLTQKSENGVEDAPVKWNFQKYLIDEDGNYVKHLGSQKKPDCDEIVKWIEGK